MSCASSDTLKAFGPRAEDGKIAGMDWKSEQYQGVRSNFATRVE